MESSRQQDQKEETKQLMKAAEDLLRCQSCKYQFDLLRREPILTNCCQDVCCKYCWTEAASKGKFRCPIECGNELSAPQEKTIPVKHLIKVLQTMETPSYVSCTKHPFQFVTTIKTSDCSFACKECDNSKGDDKKRLHKVFKKEIDIATNYMADKISIIEEKLKNCKSIIQKVKQIEPVLSSEFSDALQTIQRWSNDKNLSFLGLEGTLEEQKSDSGSRSSNKMLPRDDILELERQRDGLEYRMDRLREERPLGYSGRGGFRGGERVRKHRDRDNCGGQGRGRGRTEANNANAWGEQNSENSD
ncbi:hypothetical protein FGO68_gene12166 [Halteria grandinella]|uniref:Uncharacterized protein n=1 Tax=Halteria grandinella TaxID=5974 RepID=A0A8J8NML8_HALGN|nr:hypothetical protein FGO68_gene12166 [Halteria grandinella]